MTGGDSLAGIVLYLATIVHSTLNNWVGVMYVAESSGSELAFSVVPEGVDFAEWAANTMEQWAVLLNAVVHLPLMAADLVNILLGLLS